MSGADPSLVEAARRTVALALRKGATEAAGGAYRVRSVEVGWRDGSLERVSEATTRGVGLQLYVDGRYASVATSDLRPEAVERFVEDAVVLTRSLAVDPHRRLPEPALYQGQAQVDLDLEDPGYARLDPLARRQQAEELETAARGVPGAEAILSVTTSVGDTLGEGYRVHSNGFEGGQRSTDFGLSVQVSVRDPDGRRPEEWDAATAHHESDLPSAAEVGRGAALRALARLGSVKGASGRYAVAVENRAGGRLVGALLGPLSAASLQQRRSFLEGRLGEEVGSPLLDLADDPLVPRGLGSRLFDGEGLAARRRLLFEGGVLRSYFVDCYYGRKLGMEPTTRGASNLAWKLGGEGQDALLSRLGDGLLLTGFLGGNSNSTTGDFSLGVVGFRVRGGEVAEPVSEMNVSGNQLSLWKQLAAVGNDPYPFSAGRTPTLVFDGLELAGA